jgi:hypothetical protein
LHCLCGKRSCLIQAELLCLGKEANRPAWTQSISTQAIIPSGSAELLSGKPETSDSPRNSEHNYCYRFLIALMPEERQGLVVDENLKINVLNVS